MAPGGALAVPADITDDDQVAHLVEAATGEYDHIDVLINNAFRVPSMKPLAQTTFSTSGMPSSSVGSVRCA